ncbi:hypothetical protein [Dyadobacter sandarakinus]|uniref:Uncharacterized protein n=1 Tax=Dyadobacter sandarakinus TaxID=2747268 RepID=A0ABX7I471_9BACT|nr:hypothetical protein [Dyadobacter sandarakinus]QRR00881.1 hypothetical protein HWI92_08180 [Dyadobacter sandarakinus]
MNRKLSSIILLTVLSITDAYLLSHPNLIGKLGILFYKHSYIKNFPRALVTVLLVVGTSLLICEVVTRFTRQRTSVGVLGLLFTLSLLLFAYVYNTFTAFSYSMTGKAFIYGAHLLHVILTGLYGRYLFRQLLHRQSDPASPVSEAGNMRMEPPVPEP